MRDTLQTGKNVDKQLVHSSRPVGILLFLRGYLSCYVFSGDMNFLFSFDQDMDIEDLQEKQRLLSTASSGPATLAVDPAAATHDAHGNKDCKGLRVCYDFWPCQFAKFCRDWEMPSKY